MRAGRISTENDVTEISTCVVRATAAQPSPFLLATQILPAHVSRAGENYCYHYVDHEEAIAQLRIMQLLLAPTLEGEQLVYVAEERTFSFQLTFDQHSAFHAIAHPPRLMKTLRADPLSFTGKFIESMTHFDYKTRQPRSELRSGPRKRFTVFGSGVYAYAEKPSPYPPERLAAFRFLSRPQSVTWVPPCSKLPLFKHAAESARERVGVILSPKNALFNRFYVRDVGTVNRPYDHDTQEAAEAYYAKHINETLFHTLEDFLEAIAAQNTHHNEVMARIGWEIGEDAVGIFTDTFESRCLAQLLAQDMSEALKVREAALGREEVASDEIPIIFYLPGNSRSYTAYTKKERQADLAQVQHLLTDAGSLFRQRLFSSNHFAFLLLAANPRHVLALGWRGQPIVHMMIQRGFFHLVDGLLKRIGGFPANTAEYLGTLDSALFTPDHPVVHTAIAHSNPALIRALAARGANIHHRRHFDGVTPLQMAADRGDLTAVKALLMCPGIQVNQEVIESGITPLHLAAWGGHLLIVQLLLACPTIQVNELTSRGATPLHFAAKEGHLAIVKALLAYPGIEVRQADRSGRRPLHLAVSRGHLAVVQVLLAHSDTQVNLATSRGDTPLDVAVKKGDLAVIRALIIPSLVQYLRDLNAGSYIGRFFRWGLSFFDDSVVAESKAVHALLRQLRGEASALTAAQITICNQGALGRIYQALLIPGVMPLEEAHTVPGLVSADPDTRSGVYVSRP